MIELYPDRAIPGSLWGGANAAKREAPQRFPRRRSDRRRATT
jgi:hypothetical protein